MFGGDRWGASLLYDRHSAVLERQSLDGWGKIKCTVLGRSHLEVNHLRSIAFILFEICTTAMVSPRRNVQTDW